MLVLICQLFRQSWCPRCLTYSSLMLGGMESTFWGLFKTIYCRWGRLSFICSFQSQGASSCRGWENLTLAPVSHSFLVTLICGYLTIRTASHPTWHEWKVTAKVEPSAFFSFQNAFAPTYWIGVGGGQSLSVGREGRVLCKASQDSHQGGQGRDSPVGTIPLPPAREQGNWGEAAPTPASSTSVGMRMGWDVNPWVWVWIHEPHGQADGCNAAQLWWGAKGKGLLGKQLQELQVWGVWVGGAVSQSCPYQRAGLGGDLNMISNSLLTGKKKANFNFLKIKKSAW